MYCRFCGKTIPDDATFCNYCGKSLNGSDENTASLNEEILVQNINTKMQKSMSKKRAWIISSILLVVLVIATSVLILVLNLTKDKPQLKQNENSSQIASKPVTTTYIHYVNDRYGFSIDYPSNFYEIKQPNDDGRGKNFKSADGNATISFYGINNFSETTLESTIQDVLKNTPNIANYEQKDNWIAYSYQDGDKTNFIKEFVGDACSVIFTLSYPTSQQNEYEPIIAHMKDSFIMPNSLDVGY